MIYLDNHATTPLDPCVFEAMRPWLAEHVGNASSRTHLPGRRAAEAVEAARGRLADFVQAAEEDIIFTSGATESVNLAIAGTAASIGGSKRHMITVATEHSSVLDTMCALQAGGWEVDVLAVDSEGQIDLSVLEARLRDDTALVSVMAANNEVGTLAPLAAIAERCHARGAWLHTDAAQALGRIPFSVARTQVDLASFSAHKMYGPVGVGALFVRSRPRRVSLEPLFHGGGQERGLRPGTLNVPGIVGLGEAVAQAELRSGYEPSRLTALAKVLLARLSAGLAEVDVNGPSIGRGEPSGSVPTRLPGNLNVSIRGIHAAELLQSLDGVALSATSACASGQRGGSRVVRALGHGEARSLEALRFGVGRFTTESDIEIAAQRIVDIAVALGARAR